MFSGEAVDLTIPYLTGQLKVLEEACVTLNAVYDAHGAVYGAGTISESREKMSLRLSGLDRNGNKVQNSVFECTVDWSQWIALKAELESICDPSVDSLRYYNLGNKYKEKVIHFGAKPTIDPGSDTIII